MGIRVNDVFSWERTFSAEDIGLFSRVSGDEGAHHVVADEQGRLLVHGLLTATLPTKIGGEINFIARQMTFEFQRPVFAGDTVRCEVRVVGLEETERGISLSAAWVCRNQHGKEVMTGSAQGIIHSDSGGSG